MSEKCNSLHSYMDFNPPSALEAHFGEPVQKERLHMANAEEKKLV